MYSGVLDQHFSVDQGLGISYYFTIFCIIFIHFALKSCKKHGKGDYNQCLECAVPKRWSKYIKQLLKFL